MLKNVSIIALGLVLSLSLAACNDRGSNEGAATGTAATGSGGGQVSHAWGNAPDIGYTTFAGEKKMLSDHLGQPLVVNFWAAWCGPCVKEMPEFDTVYKASGGSFDLVAIAVDTKNDPTAFFKAQNFAFTGAFGDAGIGRYLEQSIPVTAFIDRNGNLVHKQTGGMPIEVFREHLSKIL